MTQHILEYSPLATSPLRPLTRPPDRKLFYPRPLYGPQSLPSHQVSPAAYWPLHLTISPHRAMKQVDVLVRNIQHMLAQEPLEEYSVTDPAAIHLTLGIVSSQPLFPNAFLSIPWGFYSSQPLITFG